MTTQESELITSCQAAAIEVLLHNANGPFAGLPRTSGWGYPEPYTRDLMFSMLGIAVAENKKLLDSMRCVLETLATNQTDKGHIPSLVHDPDNLGASDTTPLFLLAVGIFRKLVAKPNFLKNAVKKSLLWMEYQSPSNRYLVAQQPTSDWRDEQWVMGYGLFVNTVVQSYLYLLGFKDRAKKIRDEIQKFTLDGTETEVHSHEGFTIKNRPYYALWTYKIYSNERFDLLGNSLAILSGIASFSKANEIIQWVEKKCMEMKRNNNLKGNLPPNFFPYIRPGDKDWRDRYYTYNLPGEYHNGGVCPFVCALYISALVAAGWYKLAEIKLVMLSYEIRKSVKENLDFGFNEWIGALDGEPKGQDWQTWSAALYLYAAKCVELKKTPFFKGPL